MVSVDVKHHVYGYTCTVNACRSRYHLEGLFWRWPCVASSPTTCKGIVVIDWELSRKTDFDDATLWTINWRSGSEAADLFSCTASLFWFNTYYVLVSYVVAVITCVKSSLYIQFRKYSEFPCESRKRRRHGEQWCMHASGCYYWENGLRIPGIKGKLNQ